MLAAAAGLRKQCSNTVPWRHLAAAQLRARYRAPLAAVSKKKIASTGGSDDFGSSGVDLRSVMLFWILQ